MNKYIISIFLLILVIIISQAASYYLESKITEGIMESYPDYLDTYIEYLLQPVIDYNNAVVDVNVYYNNKNDGYTTIKIPEWNNQMRRHRRRFFSFFLSSPRRPDENPPFTPAQIKDLYNKAQFALRMCYDVDEAFQYAKNKTSVASTTSTEPMNVFLTDMKTIINGRKSLIYKMVYVCISIPSVFSDFIQTPELLKENNELQAAYPNLFIPSPESTYTDILSIFTTYNSIQNLFAVTDNVIIPTTDDFFTKQANNYIDSLNGSITKLLSIYQ
jgi:hypothetical protein